MDPQTGELLGQVPVLEADDVAQRVAAARAAQTDWALTPPSERRAVARAMLQAIVRGQDELCRVASHESGRSMLAIMVDDLMATCRALDRADRRPTEPPRGVVAIVGAGEAPIWDVFAAPVPVLADGNAVALALDSGACWSGLAFVDLLRDVLREHRRSADLVQPITGHDEAVEALRALADDTMAGGSPPPRRNRLPASSRVDAYTFFEVSTRLRHGRGLRFRARALYDFARAVAKRS